MSSLQRLQNSLAAAILSGDMSSQAGLFEAGGANATARLGIFRNNTIISLTECLKTVFPVTVKLADPRFFAYAAHEFITKHPPREARLSSYGAGFPRFLAGFDACKGFPIIAEMAVLEWAMSDSLNQIDEPPMLLAQAAEALVSGRQVHLMLQPNLRFAVSRWPLLDLWLDHQSGYSVQSKAIEPRRSRIAVMTRNDDIQCLELEQPRFAFWRAIRRGASLDTAATRVLSRDRLFDLVHETMLLFRSGLVIGAFTAANKDN
jgi:hypothetical protein